MDVISVISSAGLSIFIPLFELVIV